MKDYKEWSSLKKGDEVTDFMVNRMEMTKWI